MTNNPQLRVVQKTLTGNDAGTTGSHQAGIHVPKKLIAFFPRLDADSENPDVWLTLVDPDSQGWQCRYIHYNNAVVGSGTRDEYRITWIRPLLKHLAVSAGDRLQFERLGPTRYAVRVVGQLEPEEVGVVIVNLAKGWRSVRR